MPERITVAGGLTLSRLALTFPGGTYDVRFRAGVNIIAGPISTGKSSILQLIDFAFGSTRRPTYPEIQECSDLLLQCAVGGEVLTIRRSLREQSTKARLYDATIEDILMGGIEGREVWATYHQTEPTVGRDILGRLGLAEVKIKTAPTQDASGVNTFSVRDLMHFIYVDQDRIHSQRSAFYETRPQHAIKWGATLEIFAGLHDEAQTALSFSLKKAEADQAKLNQYFANVSDFLRKAKVPPPDDLRKRIANLQGDRDDLLSRRDRAGRATEEKLGARLELVAKRNDLAATIAADDARADELARTVAQLSRLRVQYDREKAQLEFLSECQRSVGSLPVSRCPSCLQPILAGTATDPCYVCHQALPASTEEPVPIEPRLQSISRRSRDLEAYINEVRREQEEIKRAVAQNRRELDRRDATIERVASVASIPEMRRVMELDAAISAAESEQRAATEQLELWAQVDRAGAALTAIEERTRQLRADLERLQSNRPSRDVVIQTLSGLFATMLAKVHFPALRDVRIDPRSYLPIVRDQVYGELSSRGAIALAVTAWHMAVLKYFADNPGLFPGLMMLDSPLSNVGHSEADQEFRDQQIVNGFYSLLLELDPQLQQTQLIICTNRALPAATPMKIVEFTGDPTRGRVGLVGFDVSPVETPPHAEGAGDEREGDGDGAESTPDEGRRE